MAKTTIAAIAFLISIFTFGATNFAYAHSTGSNSESLVSHSGYMYNMVDVDCNSSLWTTSSGGSLGGDTDGDTLCNAWELGTSGLVIDFKTPATGSFPAGFPYGHSFYYKIPCGDTVNGVCPSPTQKDLYVELDWMRDSANSHAPKAGAISQLITSFSNAPTPVNLHIQYGEDLSLVVDKRGEIPFHRDGLRVPGTSSLPGFYQAKENYFGTSIERSCSYPYSPPFTPPSCTNGDYTSDALKDRMTAKRQAFHYGLIAYQQYNNPAPSGWAETVGNDFLISLGATGFVGMGTTDQQDGTIMHELGHTLGLRHGGDQDFNCKPNYLSVMSFTFQFAANADNSRPLDYSRAAFSNLDENHLNENVGVGPPPVGTHYYYPGTSNERKIFYSTTSGTMVQSNVNTHNDYDGAPSGESDVSQNINNISAINGCSDGSFTNPLTGYDDWSHLNFDIFAANYGGTGAPFSRGDEVLDEENGPPGENGGNGPDGLTVSDQIVSKEFDSKGNEIKKEYQNTAEEKHIIPLVDSEFYAESYPVLTHKFYTHKEITYDDVRGFYHQHLVAISNKIDALKDEDFGNNTGTNSREILEKTIGDAIIANQKDDLPRVSNDLEILKIYANKLILSDKKIDLLLLIEDKIKSFYIAQDGIVSPPKPDETKIVDALTQLNNSTMELGESIDKIENSLTQLNNSTVKSGESIEKLGGSVSDLANKLDGFPGMNLIWIVIIGLIGGAVIAIASMGATRKAFEKTR